MRQDSCRQQHTARLTFSSFYGTKSTGCSGYREQLKIQEKPASAWGGVGALCCSVSETDALDIIRTSPYTCGCQGAPELGLHWVRSETPHPFSSVRVSSREDPLFPTMWPVLCCLGRSRVLCSLTSMSSSHVIHNHSNLECLSQSFFKVSADMPCAKFGSR